jgi:hypothetical protein
LTEVAEGLLAKCQQTILHHQRDAPEVFLALRCLIGLVCGIGEVEPGSRVFFDFFFYDLANSTSPVGLDTIHNLLDIETLVSLKVLVAQWLLGLTWSTISICRQINLKQFNLFKLLTLCANDLQRMDDLFRCQHSLLTEFLECADERSWLFLTYLTLSDDDFFCSFITF